MPEDKNPGELILKNLQLFNEAVVFFEEHIEPKILDSIENCIKTHLKDWNGYFRINTRKGIEIHPKAWSDETPYFTFDCTKDDGDFWLACLCKNSTQNARAGFWIDFDSDPTESLYEKLKELGFEEMEEQLFLPIELDNEALAKSWREKDDPCTHEDECFAPLRDTLEKLKQSVPIFEAIMGIDPTPKSS